MRRSLLAAACTPYLLGGCYEPAQHCEYREFRRIGDDRETSYGTPREIAGRFIGRFVIRPTWIPGDEGVPLPGEMDALRVEVELGERHYRARLKEKTSELWCAEDDVIVGVAVSVRNEDGSFYAYLDGRSPDAPDLWAPADAPRVRVPVVDYPLRWEAFAVGTKPDHTFDRFEIALPLPAALDGAGDEA